MTTDAPVICWPYNPRRRDPTARDLADPRFDVIWNLIKRFDVEYPDGLFGGATGNDVCAVLDELDAAAVRRRAEDLARAFHETYEEQARKFGYETRTETRRPWERLPEQNRLLMTRVCEILIERLK